MQGYHNKPHKSYRRLRAFTARFPKSRQINPSRHCVRAQEWNQDYWHIIYKTSCRTAPWYRVYLTKYNENIFFNIKKYNVCMAVPWLRRLVAGLSRRRPGFVRVNPEGFVDKVALGQVFLRFLRFSPVNIIPPWAPLFRKLKKNFFHLFIHPFTHPHPGTDNRPVKAAAVQWDVSLTPITRIQK
jgi:hypothetical protein